MTHAFYLEVPGEPIFAMFDPAAAGAPTRSTAVLLCPPLGWQDVSSYRARRDWARTLASQGYSTLRVDLPATGDSGGSPRDSGLLSAWVAALSAASRILRDLSARPRVVAVGFALGGLILYRALAEGASVDDVVLWGVSGRGRGHTREQRAFARLEQIHGRGPEDLSVPEGALLTAGFLLTADTLADLDRIDVQSLPRPRRLCRALLLERDSIPVDERLTTSLEAAGVQVRTDTGEGFADMLMAEPHEARPADEVLRQIIAWIADGEIPTPLAEPWPIAGTEMPTSTELRADDGTMLRETALHFNAPNGQLFAVLTEPLVSGAGLSAVLLNAGAQRRIGVNRMWVEIARRWAALGVACLRIDLEAIGDADGDSERFGDLGSFYVPEFVKQVRDVLDALVERGLPERFVLLGLCSGAYWAFQTALEDERVTAALMLNPRVLVWDEAHRELYEDRAGKRMKRNAAELASWRRLLTSISVQRRMLNVLRSSVLKRANVLRWARQSRGTRQARRALGEQLDHQLDRLRDRDQRGLLLFTAQEPLYEELQRDGRFPQRERWPNLEFMTDPQLRQGTTEHHTLRPLWLQQLVHARLDHALEQELERVRSRILNSTSVEKTDPRCEDG